MHYLQYNAKRAASCSFMLVSEIIYCDLCDSTLTEITEISRDLSDS